MQEGGRTAPSGRRRRSWPVRLRNGLIVFVALCMLAVGSGYAYLRYQLGRIHKIAIPGLAEDGGSESPMNVLLVGSDSRADTTGDIADATGKGDAGTAGQRSDTIMVLHIDPNQGRAAILSIPRDFYVPIGPTGNKDKINASFSIGGPELLIATIKQSLGIEINHYVEVDFEGFSRIVDTIGGMNVYVDAPARDSMTGLDLPVAGCNKVDGYQALAFVRSRYYETYERGRWVSGSNSDLDRITRQQDFIRRMMKQAISSGLSNPLTLNRLISIGVDNLTVDQQMSTKDITNLARKFRSINPDTVDMATLPTTDAYVGDASVQLLDTKNAQEYLDRLNGIDTSTSQLHPADVSVDVLNGNGLSASALKAASGLTQAGFKIVDTGDADTYSYKDTVVKYAPGRQAKAVLVRDNLVAGALIQSDPGLVTSDVSVIVGADYAGVVPSSTQAGGAGSTPPTTKVPAPSC
ncbi:MAG TPA: LCP family protein [Acidimicrobiales bacterium]|nr:LCP family protein [Acidimicrobiales bacterium]